MFLSVIIPVYNAETYIGECLTSLLRQDIPAEDYEIICVNDGSRDGSLALLQRFSRENPNLVIIDKENGGVTTARNAGLAAAKGDYIWFIDADDLIPENCLGSLRAKTEAENPDRLTFGAYQFTDAMTEEEWEKFRQGTLPVNTPWYDSVVWRCLLRRRFLEAHALTFRYPELTHGEDGLFMHEVTLCDPRTLHLEEILYFYRIHSGSAETNLSVENRMKKLRSFIRITQILRDYFEELENPADGSANKFMSFLWMTLYEITRLPGAEANAALRELKEKDLFPYRRPTQCTMDRSYMTDRTDLVGKVFDKVYLNLHHPWGYYTMRLMQKIMGR